MFVLSNHVEVVFTKHPSPNLHWVQWRAVDRGKDLGWMGWALFGKQSEQTSTKGYICSHLLWVWAVFNDRGNCRWDQFPRMFNPEQMSGRVGGKNFTYGETSFSALTEASKERDRLEPEWQEQGRSLRCTFLLDIKCLHSHTKSRIRVIDRRCLLCQTM